jgi:hypothetical protein
LQAVQTYSKKTLDGVCKQFELRLNSWSLFDESSEKSNESLQVSAILEGSLQRVGDLALLSEKARSEFIVAPILLELRELLQHQISVYSGVRFDVAPEQGLQGVCDFILTATPPVPTIQAPLLMLVEAKKNDIEEGFGQCAAEMVAAQMFNERDGIAKRPVFGCVTTGELWQFLRLEDQRLDIQPQRQFWQPVDQLLQILMRIAHSAVLS